MPFLHIARRNKDFNIGHRDRFKPENWQYYATELTRDRVSVDILKEGEHDLTPRYYPPQVRRDVGRFTLHVSVDPDIAWYISQDAPLPTGTSRFLEGTKRLALPDIAETTTVAYYLGHEYDWGQVNIGGMLLHATPDLIEGYHEQYRKPPQ